jgi:CHAD domain-containing protein
MAKAKPVTGLNIHAPTAENARGIARTRLEELYDWAEYVHDSSLSRELHNMRIATKRLRYTLEIFAEVLPDAVGDVIKEVTQIQEELGVLHDSDVMIELLQLCLEPGISYEDAVAKVEMDEEHHQVAVNTELVAYLIQPEVVPSPQQRHGLNQLLLSLQQSRKEQYTTFRQHWDTLQERKFHDEILSLLGIEISNR